MSSTVEQIKDRLGIVDVLSSYIKLEKAGKSFKGKCPFHNEKTPSFFVSPERGTYYCFGCGEKGDIFSFVERFEGVDFMGALKLLAERAGVDISQGNFTRSDPHTRLYAALEEATKFFEAELVKKEAAKKYLLDRGITEKTIAAFRIGFAPNEWRALHDALLAKGYSLDELVQIGLVKRKDNETPKEQNSTHYDVFRSRIMQPIFDASGRVIAFSGRIFEDQTSVAPKYINSPETPLFKKSETLYGFDRAKLSIRKYNFSLLVEGPIDLIMAHQSGFTNTVAVMGTAFTHAHAEKLRRLSGNIVIALDADTAGITSAGKTARIALSSGMDVKVAALPSGSDPADTILHDMDAWKKGIREASHIVDFLINHIVTTHEKDERSMKQRIRNEALPFVSLIDNGVDREHFVGQVAKALHVGEETVREELLKVSFPREEVAGAAPVVAAKDVNGATLKNRIVRQLAGIFMWHEKGEKSEFVTTAIAKTEKILGANPMTLFSADELSTLAFEAEVAFGGSDVLEKHIEEMLRHLQTDIVRERFARAIEALALAERNGEQEHAAELLHECKVLSEEINALYSE